MLHIILGILKVIGIILLAVVGLFVLCLLILLFVPVRYRISGRKEEQVLEGHVQVTWLLHAVGLTADYSEKQLVINLKLFGFVLKRIGGEDTEKKQRKKISRSSRKKKDPGKKAAEEDFKEEEKAFPAEEEVFRAEVFSREMIDKIQKESDKSPEVSPDVVGESEPEQPVLEEKNADERFGESGRTLREKIEIPIKKAMGVFQTIFRIFVKIFEFILYLPERLLDLTQKISDIFDAGENAMEKLEKTRCELQKKAEPFLTDNSRALYRRIFGYLKYFWKCYGPRKIQGWMRYGTGAPDITGQLTGLLYMFLPASADRFELLPDFTETVFETDISLKGHIRACHMIKVAFLLWRDKQLRGLIRKVRAKGGQ